MTVTDREMQILRLLEAGVALKKTGANNNARFDFSRTPAHVLGPTMGALLRKDLLTFDKQLDRFVITNAGREHVAVRTRVRDLAQSL